MKSNQKIFIIGAGGWGRELFHLFSKNQYNCVGFLDIEKKKDNLPAPILGHEKDILKIVNEHQLSCCAIAIGDMAKRKKIYHKIENSSIIFPSLIDNPINSFIKNLEEGVIVYPGVVIMNNCKIGKFTLINSGVTIGHDVVIGDFCNVNPGVNLAGEIIIGDGSLIGIGSSIKEGVRIGKNVLVGAGSVVIKDIPDNTVVYGVPAKEIIQ